VNLLNFNGIDWNLKYTISARNGGQINISGVKQRKTDNGCSRRV